MKRYIIFMSNLLSACGLQHVLKNEFNIQALTVDNASQLAMVSDIDMLFTDTITFTAQLKSFLPRLARTIVITQEQVENDNSITIISYKTHDELIVKLDNLFNRNRSESTATGSMLSQREIDVLKLVVSGCINKEIADKLGISINTVLTHRKNITAKLGIKSVSGLSFYAMMNGIVAPQ